MLINRIKKQGIFFLRLTFLLVCVDFLGSFLWLKLVLNEMTRTERSGAPVGVVLMGDFDPQSLELGRESLRRLHHAVTLWREGQMQHIFCVGGARPKMNIYGSELMKSHLIRLGIPEDKIFSERHSYDTQSNWQEIQTKMEERRWEKILMISSPIHLYRLQFLLEEKIRWEAPTVFLAPYSYGSTEPSVKIFELWRQVHYEWLAYIAKKLIPESYYRTWIKRLRSKLII